MSVSAHDFADLAREHGTLMSAHAKAQLRCSELLARQAREIESLREQAMRLRGVLIARETALAWALEDRRALEARIPGLPQRLKLVDRADALTARLQALMRAHAKSDFPAPLRIDPVDVGEEREVGELEASLAAADLVICQAGCLGHGDYWRVEDFCKRTGKPCVVVDQPETVRIVRVRERPAIAAREETTS